MNDSLETPGEAPPMGAEHAARPVISRSLLIVLAAIMGVPAMVPVLVLVEPSLVPFLEPVDTANTQMVIFMAVISLVLLVVNWGFLALIYRWLNNYANQ